MQIRKNKNGVNIQILKIFQKFTLTCMCYFAGEMERLQKFWLAGACSQKTEEGESSQPLGILNFTSAFILLAGGMLLGGLLLLLEHIYFKFFRRKLRKWDRCGCCGLVSLVCICTVPLDIWVGLCGVKPQDLFELPLSDHWYLRGFQVH